MVQRLLGWSSALPVAVRRFVPLGAALVALAAFNVSWAFAQENKEPAKQPEAAPADAKPADAKAAPAQDEHAGHDHAPAQGQPPIQVKEKKPKGAKEKTTSGDKTGKAASAGGDPASAKSGPLSDKVKAVVDATTFDFGEVWVGPKLEHAFKIKNEGTEPLEIRSVKPACGCTAAGEHPKVIKPGETGEFPFSLKSEALHDKFTKTIKVMTNEQDNSTMTLTLTGLAKQYVEVTPATISYGSLKATDTIEKTVTIKNNGEKPMELTLAEPDKNMPFKYELTEKEKGKVFELRVTTVAPIKEGTHNSSVILTTNVEEKKELKIGVAAVVPPRLAVRPSAIIFNPKVSTYPIKFTNNGDKPVTVTGVSVDNDAIKAQLSEKSSDNVAGKMYTIQVVMPEGFEIPEKQEYVLTVKTDDADTPEMKVQIKAPPKPEPRPQEKLVGKPAPSFTLTTVDGKSLSTEMLKAEKGPVVLNFWAADCGFCKLQMPRLEKVRQEYSAKNVRFINVAQKRAKAFTDDEVKEFVRTLNMGGELAIDMENKPGKEFKVNSYPSLFVLGPSGNVEHCIVGNSGTLETDLKKKLDQLLGISTTASAPATGDAKAAPATGAKPGADTKATASAPPADPAKPGEPKKTPGQTSP
ncbi:MAG: DUF1573 domain-containing protein [Phycisphaerales bacterium]|nr:DUF1573 domain-containing protein [Phycisphaerales bacterium]